jgi:hypothetical protein
MSSGEKKMAYSRNKVITYGIIGIILALAIITFIPTGKEAHIVTSLSLEEIPGYGFQIIRISEENIQVIHLILKITSVEALIHEGEWVEVSSNLEWDLQQEIMKTFPVERTITGYQKIRLNFSQDSIAVLVDGEEIQLGVPSLPMEVELSEPYSSDLVDPALKLSLGQGKGSNYNLPNIQLELSTTKLTGEIMEK